MLCLVSIPSHTLKWTRSITQTTLRGKLRIQVSGDAMDMPLFAPTSADLVSHQAFWTQCLETVMAFLTWLSGQQNRHGPGKVGLLGIRYEDFDSLLQPGLWLTYCSYYAGSQWRVAARQPKGLCAIIPWEGMSDYYRDRCRQGGILSNGFIKFWWNRQVITNQYGRTGRSVEKCIQLMWGSGRPMLLLRKEERLCWR